MNVQTVCTYLEEFAPLELAEDWDNVGLLVGRKDQQVRAIMTCLTVTPLTVAEAVADGADLIVTHHPLPFRPLQRLTTQTTPGRLLLDLIEARIAVFSPHTAFDSAAEGINQMLAESLELQAVLPLSQHHELAPYLGSGRQGTLAATRPLSEVVNRMKESLNIERVQVVGRADARMTRVAIACGSAGELLDQAADAECDLFITGEATFHRCLEAEARGLSLILLGHYASERFAVERLAQRLSNQFPDARIWASQKESDPLVWM